MNSTVTSKKDNPEGEGKWKAERAINLRLRKFYA